MYSVKAIYEGSNFKPVQPIPVNEDYEVIITFIAPVKKEKKARSELCGFLEGKVWMADDFDAPLEEMREYME